MKDALVNAYALLCFAVYCPIAVAAIRYELKRNPSRRPRRRALLLYTFAFGPFVIGGIKGMLSSR